MTCLNVKELRTPDASDALMDPINETHFEDSDCHECGETLPTNRAMLGYNVCLTCGDIVAASQRASWCIVCLPKQGATLITNKADLLHLNQKPR